MSVESAEERPADTAQPASESKAERSTIAFPYNDLDDAESIATAVHQVGGTTSQVEQVAAQLGVVHNTGPFRLRIQAAKIFGLVTSAQGTVSLTPLGMRLCDPQKASAARAEAFLTVPLYRQLYDRHKSGALPPTAGLEAEMVSLGVAPKQKDKARQSFQRSARQAGFFWAGTDRLVMPKGTTGFTPSVDPGNPDPDEEQDDTETKRRKKDRDDDGGSGRHQLIDGLIKTLPNEGTEWSLEDRHRWLNLAAGIFDFVYKQKTSGGDRRILKIDLTEPAK
jgi:hypothetical protein